MTNISDLVRIGGRLLETKVDHPWLSALIDLAENREKVTQAVKDLAAGADIDDLDGLFAFLYGKLDNADVIAAFANVDLSPLRDQLDAVKEDVQAITAKLPKPLEKLATRVSDYTEAAAALPEGTKDTEYPPAYRVGWADSEKDAGEIALPLSLFEGKEAGTSGKLGFIFEAEANGRLQVEAGATWPYSRDKVEDGFLEIALTGTLSGKAGATLPFQYGALSAEVGGKVGAQAMLYFRPQPANALYAVALAQSIAAMPNPFDLESVWKAMRDDSFAGQIFAIDGYASAKIDVGLGTIADVPEVLSAQMSLSVNVGMKRAAAYIVSARKVKEGGKPALAIAVSHNAAVTRTWGVGAKLALDLSPAFGRVKTMLERVAEIKDKNLSELLPYLSPGTWIGDKANGLIGDLDDLAKDMIKNADLRAALLQDLGKVIDGNESDSTVRAWVVEAITGKLNGVADMAFGKVDDLTRNAVRGIVEWLPALAQEDARTALEGKLDPVIAKFQAAVTAKIEAIAKTVPNGNAIKKALEKLGMTVNGTLNDLDDMTAQLRKFVAQFDAVLHKILTFVGDSAKQKIAIELSMAEERSDGTEMELVGIITDYNAQTRALWNAMMMGRLASLQEVFVDQDKFPHFRLDPDLSLLAQYSKVSRKTGFTFIGFGVELSSSLLLSAEAKVTRFANGDVAVVARSEATRDVNGPTESRSVSFISAYALRMAKMLDAIGGVNATHHSLSLDLAISHKDDSLKRTEVHGIFESLSRHDLILSGRKQRALDVYDGWERTGGGTKKPRGTIDIGFAVQPEQLQRLLDLGRAIALDHVASPFVVPADSTTLRVRQVALQSLAMAKHDDPDGYKKLIKNTRLQSYAGDEETRHEKDNVRWFLRYAGTFKARPAGARGGPVGPSSSFLVLSDRVAAMSNLLRLMADIYYATPQSDTHPDGYSAETYRQKESAMAKDAARWLDLKQKWIFWFGKDLGDATVGFFLTLIRLGNAQFLHNASAELANSHFQITMTPQTPDGQSGVVVVV